MRVDYESGGAAGRGSSHELGRSDHRGLKMQMRVNEARCNICSAEVYLFFALQRPGHTDDDAVLDTYVAFDDLAGKDIDYIAVFEYDIGLDLSKRGRRQFFVSFVVQGFAPFFKILRLRCASLRKTA